jgi:hypothetical protein
VVEAHRSAQFRGFGTSFGIVASDDELLAAAADRASLLGWRASPSSSVDVGYALVRSASDESCGSAAYRLSCDGATVRATPDLDALLDAFEDHAKIQTAARASGVLFVHAGAVAWQGRGILIPGRSRAGKSTLVHALLEAGAEYYSDEYAVLDADGRVHPYAMPLSLRADRSTPARRVRAESLGAPVARHPAPVEVILATEYRRRSRWCPRALSKGAAFLVLMDNTVAARQPPARTMPILRETVLRASAFHSRRGEAHSVARQLIASMS